MLKIVFSFFTLCMVNTIALAQNTDEKEIASAVETLRQAMVDANKSTLENLTDEHLSYGHSSGKIEDKASFVENIVSGKSDFTKITLEDQTVKIVGDVAIVRHKLLAETNDNGKPGTVNLSILLIWQKQKSGWKLLARQAVKILAN